MRAVEGLFFCQKCPQKPGSTDARRILPTNKCFGRLYKIDHKQKSQIYLVVILSYKMDLYLVQFAMD